MSEGPSDAAAAAGRLAAFDRYQQRHAWLGFPLAMLRKYADDRGGTLAAAITYHAFFSLFPLLLVFVSILGFVLQGHEDLQTRIVDSTLAQLPVIGPDLEVSTIKGNATALGIGLALALWAGLGVVLAAQDAMNRIWGVPMFRRPDFARSRLRALLLLLLLGGGLVAATALGGLSTVGADYAYAWRAGAIALAIALDFLLIWVAFRLLTVEDVSWRALRNGALLAAVACEGLQLLGGVYVNHVVKGATNTYGTFALVIGLLSWLALAVNAILIAAEANVVAARRLWPRSLSVLGERPLTTADERAAKQHILGERSRAGESVTVEFDDTAPPPAANPEPGSDSR